MERKYNIAFQARRFRLLADRVELLYPDAEHRIERAVEPTRNDLDVMLAGGASEADRICAAAVKMLREPECRRAELLDLLGTLSPDNLLGVYFALAPDRRAVLKEDPVWAYHVHRAPDDMGEAEFVVEGIAADSEPLPESDDPGLQEFKQKLLKRHLGLPVEMSEAEEAMVAESQQVLSAIQRGEF